MATEIRDLQDQLYEYDHEYRLLEQELESLRRRNNRPGEAHSFAPSTELVPSSPLQFAPRDELPSPRNSANPQHDSSPNSRSNATPSQPTLPSIISEPEGSRPAPVPTPEGIRPALPNPQAPPSDGSDPATDFDFDPEEITIPSITTSSIQPPNLAPRKLDRAPENDLEIGLSQIELPLQLASSPDAGRGASISQASEQITDQRVVELAFHPLLCRSVNFDDDEHEDGIFLVLQPRNRAGQFVPVPASLTIEVVDRSRETEKSQIGYWRYSASEVKDKIQPIGSQQGIHLTLPWNGPNPKADRITVRATYLFENGRQIAGNKELFISGPGRLKTVWAPRASSQHVSDLTSPIFGSQPSNTDPQSSAVVTASAEGQMEQSRPAAYASGPFPPPDAAPEPEGR